MTVHGNSGRPDKSDRTLMAAGMVGLIGALLVGIGEFTLQFSAAGGYDAADYRYFADVSAQRLSIGHFLSVLAAPLYLIGYWHLGQAFSRGGSPRSGQFIFLVGSYAFVVGIAWLGGRIYLALLAQQLAGADAALAPLLSDLLARFAAHNEPLVNVLRIAMLAISLLWIWRVAAGATLYPRWMALFSPIALLASIFAAYFFAPAWLGAWLLPAAMNLAHALLFALSLLALRQARQ